MKKAYFFVIILILGIVLLFPTIPVKADIYSSKNETTAVVWLVRAGNIAAPVTQSVDNRVGFWFNQISSTERYVTKLDLCITAYEARGLYLGTGFSERAELLNLSCYRNGSLINSFSGYQLTYPTIIDSPSDLVRYGYRSCNYLYNPLVDSWNVRGETILYFDAAINSWQRFSIYY
ncbi:hypothetical protein ACAG39_06850 [Caldicellulosiruptoraceae bacterium PP1]